MDISEIRALLTRVPFFILTETKLIISYSHQHTTIIITGIKKSYVDLFIKEYKENTNAFSPFRNYRIEIVNQTSFWYTIQLNNPDAASNFQKFIRSKKRQLDNEGNLEYKIDKKRIRIIIMN